jgi:hypothetical protein
MGGTTSATGPRFTQRLGRNYRTKGGERVPQDERRLLTHPPQQALVGLVVPLLAALQATVGPLEFGEVPLVLLISGLEFTL